MGAYIEICTSLPCRLNCRFCPQDALRQSSEGVTNYLSFENFVKAMDKMPDQTIVVFSGFSEPFQNKDTIKMIEYAAGRGFSVRICSTLLGVTKDIYKRILEVNPDDLGIHLPDAEGNTKFPITKEYVDVLKYIIINPTKYVKFNHHGKDVHPAIKKYVTSSRSLLIHDRGGLLKEGIHSKKSKIVACAHEFQFTHLDGACVMLPNGDCVMCCHCFDLSNKIGNLLEESWDILKSRIRITEKCSRCIDGIEG